MIKIFKIIPILVITATSNQVFAEDSKMVLKCESIKVKFRDGSSNKLSGYSIYNLTLSKEGKSNGVVEVFNPDDSYLAKFEVKGSYTKDEISIQGVEAPAAEGGSATKHQVLISRLSGNLVNQQLLGSDPLWETHAKCKKHFAAF